MSDIIQLEEGGIAVARVIHGTNCLSQLWSYTPCEVRWGRARRVEVAVEVYTVFPVTGETVSDGTQPTVDSRGR